MSTRLNLSDNQKAAVLALHHAGGTLTYAQVALAGQARMLGCWSLVRTKHLATFFVVGQVFKLTDRGALIARMLLR